MAPTLRPAEPYGTSPRSKKGGRDRVVRAYGELCNSASEDAAHQRMRRVQREFFDLVRTIARAGAPARLERLRVLFEDAARAELPCTNDDCLLDATDRAFHADAVEDAARHDLLRHLSPAAEARLLRTLYAEIAAKREKVAILEARKAARHG